MRLNPQETILFKAHPRHCLITGSQGVMMLACILILFDPARYTLQYGIMLALIAVISLLSLTVTITLTNQRILLCVFGFKLQQFYQKDLSQPPYLRVFTTNQHPEYDLAQLRGAIVFPSLKQQPSSTQKNVIVLAQCALPQRQALLNQLEKHWQLEPNIIEYEEVKRGIDYEYLQDKIGKPRIILIIIALMILFGLIIGISYFTL